MILDVAADEEVPIYVADYVLGSYGSGAIMAVPGHDSRDFEFAKTYGISVRQVVQPAGSDVDGTDIELPFCSSGLACRSSSSALDINGMESAAACAVVVDWLVANDKGNKKV